MNELIRIFAAMSEKRYYRVAGFVFGIDSPECSLFDSLQNLSPFRTERTESEHIFDLEIVDAVNKEVGFVFRTADGPGFPEITIYESDGGWLIRVKPLPHLPEASAMWIREDFSAARLCILRKEERSFAVNNALMLMFAFSTACRGALEMHSSVVMNGGKGYLFLGRSGTGKSTHSRLWIENIPGTVLLNDDNPILRLMPDGTARVFGSPWSGKTPCYKAEEVPAGAVVQLKQAPYNKIERMNHLQTYATLMSSASSFRPFKELADGWHRTLEGLVSVLPCYQLECLPDAAAAKLSYDTIHG